MGQQKEYNKPKTELIPEEILEYLQKTKEEEILDLRERGLLAVDVTQHYKLKTLILR